MAAVEFDKVFQVMDEAMAEGKITVDDIFGFMSHLVSKFSTSSQTTGQAEETESMDERIKIKKLIEIFGVPKHINGYKYLPEAISYYRKAGRPKAGEIYENVSKLNNTTVSGVERSIRHAIKIAFSRGRYEDLVFLFGENIADMTEKPTNCVVIATLAERVDTVLFPNSNNGSANVFDTFVKSLEKEEFSKMEILKMIRTEINDKSQQHPRTLNANSDNQDLKVIRLLESMGVKKHFKGYPYLMEAIKLYQKNPYQKVTQELYPAVAEKFETTSGRVEKDIRCVVQNACDRCSEKIFYEIFGNSIKAGEVPTNSQAIAALAEKLEYMD